MATTLKENIIERMEAKNLSIAELERLAGLSIHSVRNILKGRIKKPSAQSLQAIAVALECSIIDLMNNSPSKGEGFPYMVERKIKKGALLEHPALMLECAQKVWELINKKTKTISVDEYLEVVKKVYFYSSREEPRKFDMRFAGWLVENSVHIAKAS